MNENNTTKKNTIIFGCVIITLGFIISIYIAYRLSPPAGIGIMGLGILLTMLIGGNILSKEQDLTTAEVRRAIAVSCISVFIGLLAFGNTIELKHNILKPVFENFCWIIITIVGFYFGGRSAEKIVENITERWAKRLEERVENIEKDLVKSKKE